MYNSSFKIIKFVKLFLLEFIIEYNLSPDIF
jgi:hypothetical protein